MMEIHQLADLRNGTAAAADLFSQIQTHDHDPAHVGVLLCKRQSV